jgi:hypothetical protein
MNQIQIPVVTTMGKFIVIGYCLLIVVAVLYWGLPKFNVFLHVVFGRSKRPQGVKGIYLIFGFAVYACIFALAALATNIGLDVQLLRPRSSPHRE